MRLPKVRGFIRAQRTASATVLMRFAALTTSYDFFADDNDYFRSRFTSLRFAVDMNRVMFIGSFRSRRPRRKSHATSRCSIFLENVFQRLGVENAVSPLTELIQCGIVQTSLNHLTYWAETASQLSVQHICFAFHQPLLQSDVE
jgi:hypothetical protein